MNMTMEQYCEKAIKELETKEKAIQVELTKLKKIRDTLKKQFSDASNNARYIFSPHGAAEQLISIHKAILDFEKERVSITKEKFEMKYKVERLRDESNPEEEMAKLTTALLKEVCRQPLPPGTNRLVLSEGDGEKPTLIQQQQESTLDDNLSKD
jgi:hypothetical protein